MDDEHDSRAVDDPDRKFVNHTQFMYDQGQFIAK
jgi:hypothetical protein